MTALIKGKTVSTTFQKVSKIIVDTSGIDIDTITSESHTIDDLGIDSVDFLDIVLPSKRNRHQGAAREVLQEVNDGKASNEDYFVMKNLCAKIDALFGAKNG